MKKRVFKKIYPMQYMYPNNTDVYQYTEDRYIVFEGNIDNTKICFYNRVSSILHTTKDGGKTFEEQKDEMIFPSYFTAVDVNFEDIIENIIPSTDGLVEEIVE